MSDAPRVLVVGASSGIGRSIATTFVRAGAAVVFSARRAEALADAVAEAGGGHAIPADVTVAGDAERLAGAVAAVLGGLDVVVYATGVSPLARLTGLSEADWLQVLNTNTVGFNAVARAVLPLLAGPAQVAAISSDSVGAPRPGLVHYAASKAALEESIRGWRAEVPDVRWTTITVGATFPTEFGVHFDPVLMGELFADWSRLGIVHATLMDTDELADVIVDTLQTLARHPGIGAEDLVLRPASGIVADTAPMGDAAEANAAAAGA